MWNHLDKKTHLEVRVIQTLLITGAIVMPNLIQYCLSTTWILKLTNTAEVFNIIFLLVD